MRALRFAPRPLAPLLVVLMPWAQLGCADEPAPEPDDHVAVKLSFDQITYVDAALAPRKVSERIRNEVQSIFPALRKADALILSSQQVELDVAELKKEPVTVVDPATGASRAALRIRHHYVTLAQVPKALAGTSELPLGVLHGGDGAHTEAVLAECTANGERERQAVGELWTVFDPSLPSCAAAMGREQVAIDAARQKLQHPEREIVTAELGRTYLPVTVHLRRRPQGPDAGDYALPVEGEHVDDPRAHASPDGPAPPPSPGEQPGFVVIDRSAEKAAAEQLEHEPESEDEIELRKQARALGGDAVVAPAPPSYGGYTYLQPNYALLYVAIVAFVVLAVGKRRQQSKR
jgi:hypothetical protein